GAKYFLLRVIDKGYAVPFITFPQNAFFDNNLSALTHVDFLFKYLSPPHVVNPLSVSIQSCGKKRLILDLRHVNKHIWKEKFKFEDIRDACVVRVLVRYWRSHAVRITVYLDDGLGSARDFARCEAASLFVKTSLQLSGFLPNDSKSIWQPTSCLVWLGYCIDLAVHTISIPSVRILSVVQVIDSIRSQYPSTTARKLAQLVGKVISMGFVFGNITRLKTRYSHFDILRSPTWDGKISLSGSTLKELCFWKENITQFHYSRVCYSDASSTGCASYMLDLHNTISHKL
ncbi:unnamed protein product, partial [Porites evermanni]